MEVSQVEDTDRESPTATSSKKNKLGYTRISIACEHCRRRKIRCVKDDEAAEKCANCIKLNKECIFTSIDSSVLDSKAKTKKTPASGASSAFQPSPTGPRPEGYNLSPGHQLGPSHAYMEGASPYTDPSRLNPIIGPAIARSQPSQWLGDDPTGYHAPHLQPAWTPRPNQARLAAYGPGAELQQPANSPFQYLNSAHPNLPPQVSYALPGQHIMAPTFQPPMQQAQYYAQPPQGPFYNHYQTVDHRQTTTHQAHHVSPIHTQFAQPHVVPSNQPAAPPAAWQQHAPLPQSAHLVVDVRHDSMWPRASSYSQQQQHGTSSQASSATQRKSKTDVPADPPD